MNISKILLWSASLTLVTTALVAQGFGPGMGGGRCQGQGATSFLNSPMARFLNLTEAQRVSMKGVRDRHQVSFDGKLTAAAEAQNAMRSAMLDPATGDAQLKALQGKVAEAQLPVMLERRAMMVEFEAILTPDQKAALDKQRLQGGPGSGMGHGMGRGCGTPGMGGF